MASRKKIKLAPAPPRRPALRSDPAFTTGDVLVLLQPENLYMPSSGELHRLLKSVLVAMAATARVGFVNAAGITLKDWNEDTVEVASKKGAKRKPVWTPVVREAVRRYRNALPEEHRDAPMLLVSRNGRGFSSNGFARTFVALGKHYGMPGDRICTRLLEYFDRQFDGEEDARAAVAALAGQRVPPDDKLCLPSAHIKAASEDRRLLERVLADNHELAGDWTKLLGPAGMRLAGKTRKLFQAKCIPNSKSAAMSTDSICIALARLEWSHRQRAQRKRLKAEHFDHFYGLRAAGLLRDADLAFLFHVTPRTVSSWCSQKRLAERSAEEIAEKRRWAEALPELYLARGRMITPAMFHEQIVRRMHFPFDYKWMLGVLLNRKALGRRKRVFRSRGEFTLPGTPSPSSAA